MFVGEGGGAGGRRMIVQPLYDFNGDLKFVFKVETPSFIIILLVYLNDLFQHFNKRACIDH